MSARGVIPASSGRKAAPSGRQTRSKGAALKLYGKGKSLISRAYKGEQL